MSRLPRAKEQFFADILLRNEKIGEDYRLFLREAGVDTATRVGILAFHAEQNPGYLEKFVLTNIMEELFSSQNVLLHVMIERDILYLLREECMEELEPLVEQVKQEFDRYGMMSLQAIVSRTAPMEDSFLLYQEILALSRLRLKGKPSLILSSRTCEGETCGFFNHEKIRHARTYEDVLLEICLGISKMRMEGLSETEMKAVLERGWIILWGEKHSFAYDGIWSCAEETAIRAARQLGIRLDTGDEDGRMVRVLHALYQNLSNQDLSIRYLAREVLYMNEDYLGRLFQKHTGEKYSSYIQRVRMMFAKRLLTYNPELKVSELAEQAGYPTDGQYFSRTFKKYCGVTPSEYRESEKNRNERS